MKFLFKDNWKYVNPLSKLFILFFSAMLMQYILISPTLEFIFKEGAENRSALQTKSLEIASANPINADNLQATIINGAKTIKKGFTRNDVWFVYCSLISYTFLCFLTTAFLFRKQNYSQQELSADWKKSKLLQYLLTPALLLFSLPLISESIRLNDVLGINWLVSQTDFTKFSVGNMIFSYAVIVPENLNQVAIALLFTAVLPAFAEELFFRGALQKILIAKFGNVHNAIFVTAFIFSALHMDLTAFFYRFFLGVLLGYLFIWTKNLLIPIILHALNNGATVFSMYYTFTEPKAIEMAESASAGKGNLLILSTTLLIIILGIYYKYSASSGPENI